MYQVARLDILTSAGVPVSFPILVVVSLTSQKLPARQTLALNIHHHARDIKNVCRYADHNAECACAFNTITNINRSFR